MWDEGRRITNATYVAATLSDKSYVHISASVNVFYLVSCDIRAIVKFLMVERMIGADIHCRMCTMYPVDNMLTQKSVFIRGHNQCNIT